ncbi:MAG: AEC family transporter [Candidatus Bipolaricaulis sp.]|nr:AEC family transporter [Candidatus Bipolaricaulis sp.]
MFLVNVIVPVVLIAGAGYLFARTVKSDLTPFTRLSFFVLTPILIFDAMLSHSLSSAVLANVTLFVFASHAAFLLLAFLGVRWTRWDADTKTAAVLSLTFGNCGIYGLPVLLFAFGDEGFAIGVVYMVAQLAFQVLFGVGVASWRKGMSMRSLVREIFAVPWLLAIALGVAVRLSGLQLPAVIARPVELLADAAIPIQLLLLGMTLTQVRLGGLVRQAAPLSLAKLVVPPLVAWGLAAAFGFNGLVRSILILEAGTPTAVNALILSLQYNRRSELSAAVVLLTTIAGVGVTSVLLWLLG